jgi:shikimate kinase
MHGAVSIVNAIATGKGSALGVSLELTAEVGLAKGKGLRFISGKDTDKLVNNIVRSTLSKTMLENNQVIVKVRSRIPIGFGLKSSSAISNAVALACARLIDDNVDDERVLQTAVSSSLAAGVSITGAMDDACACYYGGFVVTDNHKRKLIRREPAPSDLVSVIFLPRNTARGNIAKLSAFTDLFDTAFYLAHNGDYWNAMKLNGVLAAAALSSSYAPSLNAIEAGAYGVSISGNGPSIAAVASNKEARSIQAAFSKHEGRIITSNINNEKATSELLEYG